MGLGPAFTSGQEPAQLSPLEPSDTASPAATLNSLINSCNELHRLISDETSVVERVSELLPAMERIRDCLDLTELPNELQGTAGLESALFLKEVLDRIPLPPDADIPQVIDAQQEDGNPLLRWQIPNTRISLARKEVGPRKNAYLFTPETVRRAAQDYRMVKPLAYRTDGRSISPGLYEAYSAITKQEPTRSTDTTSPRGTLTLFLDSCNELNDAILQERHFDRSNPELHRLGAQIVSCLDTSQLPEYAREYFDAEAAVCLKEVLDRSPLTPPEAIPGIESVENTDGGAALLRWQIPRTQIVISRMQDGPRRGEYLFSAETVSRAPEFYRRVAALPYRNDGQAVSEGFYEWWLSSPGNPTVAAIVERLPNWFQQRPLDIATWQWLGMLPAIPISLALIWLGFRLERNSSDRSRGRSLWRYWLSLGFVVLAILVPIGFKHFLWEYLTLRGSALYIANFCADIVFLVGVVGLIIGVSTRIGESIIALPHVSPKGLDANLIRMICRVLGIVAAVIVFLEGGRYLGFPLTTLVASAGIGGLAIALSAQGLIKGLFGTVSILLDKPYRVGDHVIIKGHQGIIEEIGLRSTKIRALNNHLITIPNDQIADAEIENVGKRNHIRRSANLHLPLDTPRAKVEQAVACIRSVLENHDGMDPELPPRVNFIEFDPEAFNIRLTYWFAPPDIWEFYSFAEQVNLEICRAFEEQGIQFSLPIRHSYWKHDDEQGPLELKIINKPEPPMT
jgi:MscS family membrane protein